MNQEQATAAPGVQDPEALEALVESCGDRLFRSAFLLCGNETDAEDLVQGTFLQGLRSFHRFRNQSSIYTWLHSILLNLVRHYHRTRHRLVYDGDAAKTEPALLEEAQSGLDLELTSAALLDAMARLSAPHREVLVLRYYEDLPIREMAVQLRVSEGTVKSRLHYAILELQKHFPMHLNLFGALGTKEMKT